MSKPKPKKFTEKYQVSTNTIYRIDPERLVIPTAGHPLHDPTSRTTPDPLRMEVIDRDGQMEDPVEVATDTENDQLIVLDGRGRTIDVRAVNAQRKKEGREIILIPCRPFNVPGADEKRLVMRVRERNYHRRQMTVPSHMAIDIIKLRNMGCSFEDIAKTLHHETADAEQWCRRMMPLAYCVAEVQAAIDSGELPQGAAQRFGGTSSDGEKKLSRKDQLELLAQIRRERLQAKTKPKSKALSPKAQSRARAALENGESRALSGDVTLVAEGARLMLARIAGDKKALDKWPELAAIVDGALDAKAHQETAK